MKDYTLSKEKIAELEKFHRSLRDKRQADRVKAVIALSRGWSAAQVAPTQGGKQVLHIQILVSSRITSIVTVFMREIAPPAKIRASIPTPRVHTPTPVLLVEHRSRT
jgi:hypothetical protein